MPIAELLRGATRTTELLRDVSALPSSAATATTLRAWRLLSELLFERVGVVVALPGVVWRQAVVIASTTATRAMPTASATTTAGNQAPTDATPDHSEGGRGGGGLELVADASDEEVSIGSHEHTSSLQHACQ